MHFYRMAYEMPRETTRRRATFVAPTPLSALRFAGAYCKVIGASLLGLEQQQEAQVNEELRLT